MHNLQKKIEKPKSLKYFQNMLRFFIKNGKKSIIENNMFNYINFRLRKRNMSIKQSFFKLLLQSRNNLLQYVKLKIKRRGRRIKYKVLPLLKEKPNKKALLSFAKVFYSNNNQNFVVKFSKELKMVSNGQSVIVGKRNEIYKKAFKIYYVRRKKKKKKLNKITTVNDNSIIQHNIVNINQIIKKLKKKKLGRQSRQILNQYLINKKTFRY